MIDLRRIASRKVTWAEERKLCIASTKEQGHSTSYG